MAFNFKPITKTAGMAYTPTSYIKTKSGEGPSAPNSASGAVAGLGKTGVSGK